MCYFITLIAPTDDADAVRAVMDRHGREAKLIDNPSIRSVLQAIECQYLTTKGHCDCGTVLARRHDTPEALEAKLAKEAARMQRKGWSKAKIARAMEDRRRSDARPGGDGSDSLELWNAALRDLRETLKLPHAALLVRQYSGLVTTEAFDASRRELPGNMEWLEALATLQPDEVTIFPFG